MKKFISIIWEEGNINESKLVESMIGTANIPLKENKIEYVVGETDQGANLLRIGIAKNLSESEYDKLAQKIANNVFEMGLSEFDIEFTTDGEVVDEETYDGDDFFEAYGVMWFNEDDMLDEAYQEDHGVGVVYELTRLEGVTESQEQKISVKDILVYLKKVMGTESHEDWRNNVIDNNKYFVLKNIPLNSLWIDLPMLDKANVEKYKQMDFSKAPPIVIGSDGNIIDGYHRANVAKALGIKSIKAYVGVKGVTESLEETYDGDDFYEAYGDLWFNEDEQLDEAEYHGRKVPLGKPIRSSGGPKKFHVFVKNGDKVKKVNFGDPNMKIKKSNPARRRSFRARHNCDNPGPRTSARYWSCRNW